MVDERGFSGINKLKIEEELTMQRSTQQGQNYK
jgi:hypothetical protein